MTDKIYIGSERWAQVDEYGVVTLTGPGIGVHKIAAANAEMLAQVIMQKRDEQSRVNL